MCLHPVMAESLINGGGGCWGVGLGPRLGHGRCAGGFRGVSQNSLGRGETRSCYQSAKGAWKHKKHSLICKRPEKFTNSSPKERIR